MRQPSIPQCSVVFVQTGNSATRFAKVSALTRSHPRPAYFSPGGRVGLIFSLPPSLLLPPIPGYPSILFYFAGSNNPPIRWKDGEECDSGLACGGDCCCSLTTATCCEISERAWKTEDLFVKFFPLECLSFIARHVSFSFSWDLPCTQNCPPLPIVCVRLRTVPHSGTEQSLTRVSVITDAHTGVEARVG